MEPQLIEQTISDFYESIEEHGSVIIYVIGDEYYINNSGTGYAFAKDEIEWAKTSTSLPVEYIRLS